MPAGSSSIMSMFHSGLGKRSLVYLGLRPRMAKWRMVVWPVLKWPWYMRSPGE